MENGIVFLGFYRKDERIEKQKFDILITTDKIGVENWFNILANKLGFDNLKSYIDSYPDNFRSGRSANYYGDGMLCMWSGRVYDGDTRLMINILHYYLIGKNNVDYNYMIENCIDYLSELIVAPTIEEFKTYNKFKNEYGENDLWFCNDWSEE